MTRKKKVAGARSACLVVLHTGSYDTDGRGKWSTMQGQLKQLCEAVETNGTMPTDMVQALYVITENITPHLPGYNVTGSMYEKEVYTDCETDIGTISGTRASVNRIVSVDVFSFSISGDSSKYLWIDDGDACKLYRDGMLVAED